MRERGGIFREAAGREREEMPLLFRTHSTYLLPLPFFLNVCHGAPSGLYSPSLGYRRKLCAIKQIAQRSCPSDYADLRIMRKEGLILYRVGCDAGLFD